MCCSGSSVRGSSRAEMFPASMTGGKTSKLRRFARELAGIDSTRLDIRNVKLE